MADLAVNLRLAHYANMIQGIMDLLHEAGQEASNLAGLLTQDGFYNGDALPLLQTFYTSYTDNIKKLWYFQSVANRFLWQVIRDFGKADADLAAVIRALAVAGAG